MIFIDSDKSFHYFNELWTDLSQRPRMLASGHQRNTHPRYKTLEIDINSRMALAGAQSAAGLPLTIWQSDPDRAGRLTRAKPLNPLMADGLPMAPTSNPNTAGLWLLDDGRRTR
jgi:hypothetical protein